MQEEKGYHQIPSLLTFVATYFVLHAQYPTVSEMHLFEIVKRKLVKEVLVDVVKMKMVLSDAEDEPAEDEEAQKE